MDRAWGWDHMNKSFDLLLEGNQINASDIKKIIAYLDVEEVAPAPAGYVKRHIEATKTKRRKKRATV